MDPYLIIDNDPGTPMLGNIVRAVIHDTLIAPPPNDMVALLNEIDEATSRPADDQPQTT